MNQSHDSSFFVQDPLHDSGHGHLNEPSKDSKMRKYLLVGGIAVVIVFAGIGATVGVLVSNASSSSSNDNNSKNDGNTSLLPEGVTPVDSASLISDKPPAANPRTDPDIGQPAFTMLAIGDYGGTTGKEGGYPGSCCKLYKETGEINKETDRYKVDFYSQKWVAELMGLSAAELKPVRVIGHGDNFYWNGIGSKDWDYRFQTTFEEVYNQPSLQNVKWVNVAGNHGMMIALHIVLSAGNVVSYETL
jgi:tartrate-resistant acid phosphatase type 5